VISHAAARRVATRWRAGSRYLPGLALVVVIGAVAVVVEQALMRLTGAATALLEALVIAIIIGVILRNTVGQPAIATAGVGLAGKQVLELAVVLLGASVNFGQLLQAGPRVLLLIALCVALTLPVCAGIGRLLGLSPKLAILVAVGNAICGNSAIAAAAPAIRADKKDIAVAIALTAVVGVVLVLGLPWLISLTHMTMYQYGVLVGTTVYAVPQVVAAAAPVGVEAVEVAAFVKLMRVVLLGPVVLGLSLLFARERATGAPAASGWRHLLTVPWFVAGFLLLAALNSLGVFAALGGAAGLTPATLGAAAQATSKLLMIGAMAALGLGVEFAVVRTVGPRVGATVVLSLLFLVTLSLGLIAAFGL
jgi:uncharacterized integral membrane protein (TIGR00698 family)